MQLCTVQRQREQHDLLIISYAHRGSLERPASLKLKITQFPPNEIDVRGYPRTGALRKFHGRLSLHCQPEINLPGRALDVEVRVGGLNLSLTLTLSSLGGNQCHWMAVDGYTYLLCFVIYPASGLAVLRKLSVFILLGKSMEVVRAFEL